MEAVSNVVQRDECFLASVDLNDTLMIKSPDMKYLDRYNYVTGDGS